MAKTSKTSKSNNKEQQLTGIRTSTLTSLREITIIQNFTNKKSSDKEWESVVAILLSGRKICVPP